MAKLPTLKPRLQTLKTSQPISNVTANKRNRGRSWRKLRLEVLLRDKYTCQHCGLVSISLEVDHTIPLSKGGLHVESNLRCACRKFNGLKSDRVYQLI